MSSAGTRLWFGLAGLIALWLYFCYSLLPSKTASIIIEGYRKNMSFLRGININCVENLLLCFNEALISRVKTSAYLMPLRCFAFLFHFKNAFVMLKINEEAIP